MTSKQNKTKQSELHETIIYLKVLLLLLFLVFHLNCLSYVNVLRCLFKMFCSALLPSTTLPSPTFAILLNGRQVSQLVGRYFMVDFLWFFFVLFRFCIVFPECFPSVVRLALSCSALLSVLLSVHRELMLICLTAMKPFRA